MQFVFGTDRFDFRTCITIMNDLFGDDSDEGESLFSVIKPQTKAKAHKEKKKERKLPEISPQKQEMEKIEPTQKQTEEINKNEPIKPEIIEKPIETQVNNQEIEKIQNQKEPEISEMIQEKPKRKKVRRRKEKLSQENEQLNENPIIKFKNDILQKFDELQLQVDSLQKSQNLKANYKYVTIPQNEIMAHVKAVNSNLIEKDAKINELQSIIDNLSSYFCESEEKQILQHKISDLNHELLELQQTIQNESEIKKQLEILEKENNQIETELKTHEEKEKEQYNKETEKLKQNLVNDVKEIQEIVELTQSSIDAMKEQFNTISNENKQLKSQNENDNDEGSQKIKLLKQQINQKIQNTIKALVNSTYSVLNEGIDTETEYSGKMCLKAIQSALQIATDEVLYPEEEDEEEQN